MNGVQADPHRGARRVLGVLAVAGAIALGVARPRPGLSPPDVDLRVDPSTCPADVLLALPGLGPARVGAIEAARRRGPFRAAGDFDRRVKGIGPATMAGLAPYLRFDLDRDTHRGD